MNMAEADSTQERIQQVKKKAPTNKERFQSMEQQIAGLTAALGQLVATQAPPTLSAPASIPPDLDLACTPPHLSRASTPKPTNPVRRDLISNFQEPPCNSSLLADQVLSNGVMLNDEITKRHADHIAQAAVARLPRSSGKLTFDVFLNKTVAYDMPRHYLSIHSQRRVRTLDSFDDLTLPEFLQGYIAMVSKKRPNDPTYEAMVRCLGLLGEALVDYQWQDMRDWVNSVLHEVGQGRLSWLDDKVIADRLNTTKLRASMRAGDDPTIPVCAQFNQGRCQHNASHGVFQHVCALCWVSSGAQFPHSAQNCRRKNSSYQGTNRNNHRDASQGGNNAQYGNNGRFNNNGRDRRPAEAHGSYALEGQAGTQAKN